MRALITNPEQYASKLVNDEPAAIQFKNDKTIAALQQMLNKMWSSPPIATPSSNAHVRQLAQQLVDPSSSAGLQPPACSAPIVSLPNQPSSSMHTVRGAAAEELNITNALMDMILSLQNQMQEMQRINQTLQPTTDDTDNGVELQQTQKPKRGTVCSTSTVTCPEQLPSTSVAADVPITSPTDDTYMSRSKHENGRAQDIQRVS